MFKLTQKKEEQPSVSYGGRDIPLNLSYDSVLRCMEVQEDDAFLDEEKVVLLFRILTKDYKQYAEFNVYDRAEVVQMAFELLSEGRQAGEKPPVEPYNFALDAERIYSSFLKEYDIDLLEKQGSLSWQKFVALFGSLGEDTPIMKAIQYRLMEIPPASKIGQEERDRLLKLKQAYELPSHKRAREEAMLKEMQARVDYYKKRRGKKSEVRNE